MAKIAVIGAGFAGLSAAAYLSAEGHDVHVFEKHDQPGGRARQLKTNNGYTFDMGPSWYWMPDVFERFFNDFGYNVEQLYQLDLLDPSFDIVCSGDKHISIPNNYAALRKLFGALEPGSSGRLDKFLKEAHYKYATAIESLIHMPGLSLREVCNSQVLKGIAGTQIFTSLSSHVRRYFSHPVLISLMEFPVLFLGAMPKDTPALYSLMNHAALKLGTWYPQGGMGKVVDAMIRVAGENGASFYFNAAVEEIKIRDNEACAVVVDGETIECDAVVAAADYHHVEASLLPQQYRNYSEAYWSSKVLAPSCLIYYLGVTKRLNKLQHHTLFFDENFQEHAQQIYKDPKWPTKPLFYVCCTSASDTTVAPEGCENLFLLMPIAPGLKDTEETREQYFEVMMHRLEKHAGEDIRPHINYKKSYCVNDFVTDYNAYKGNAYGLANTLMQTAFLKPKIKNKKISNLFYAGQLTVPGPGVPPALISGKIVATQLMKQLNKKVHETAF